MCKLIPRLDATQYLSAEERAAAPSLYAALCAAEAQYTAAIAAGRDADATTLIAAAMEVLEAEPMFGEVDYVSVADGESFRELGRVGPGGGAVVSAAVALGNTRLIDNIVL